MGLKIWYRVTGSPKPYATTLRIKKAKIKLLSNNKNKLKYLATGLLPKLWFLILTPKNIVRIWCDIKAWKTWLKKSMLP